MSFSKAKRLGLTFKGKSATIVDLSKPIVSMTPARKEFADSVIREHFAEDRTEIVKQPRVKRSLAGRKLPISGNSQQSSAK
jgi:hypothetical protein